MRKGIISIIFCIVAIFSFAVTAWAVDASWLENTHYGYSSLSTAGEKSAYKAIYEGIEDEEGAITIDTGWHITRDQLKKICRYYMHDSPEHCWLMADGNTFDYTYDTVDGTEGTYITRVKPNYNGSKDSMAAKFNNAVKAIVDKANSGTTYDKARKAHDLLAVQVNYDYSALSGGNNYAHRAYGALVNDLAVCDGYAYAYQVILNKMGIKAITVPGYGNGTISGAHAWNMVEFEPGKWAYVDVTWDDQLSLKTNISSNLGVIHYYFGCADDIIAENMAELNSGGKADHLIVMEEKGKKQTYDELPKSVEKNTDGRSPYWYKDIVFKTANDLDASKIAETVVKYDDLQKATCDFVYYGEEDLGTWLGSNIRSICPFSGTFKYECGGIIEKGCYFINMFSHEHSGGTATCLGKYCEVCGKLYDKTTLGEHKYGPLIPKIAATQSEDGLWAHYYCDVCHRYFDKDKNEVEYEDLIIKRYTPGDINGDGAVNNKDVIVLFRYLSGAEMGEGFSLGACDPNNDGEFNNKDVNRLFNYISYPSKRETDYVLH